MSLMEKSNSNWRKLFLPVKATRILSQAYGKSNKPKAKPNPPFKKESWKKPQPTNRAISLRNDTKAKQSKSAVEQPSKSPTKSILRKKDSTGAGQKANIRRVKISDKPSVHQKPSSSKKYKSSKGNILRSSAKNGIKRRTESKTGDKNDHSVD